LRTWDVGVGENVTEEQLLNLWSLAPPDALSKIHGEGRSLQVALDTFECNVVRAGNHWFKVVTYQYQDGKFILEPLKILLQEALIQASYYAPPSFSRFLEHWETSDAEALAMRYHHEKQKRCELACAAVVWYKKAKLAERCIERCESCCLRILGGTP
jgi:hypothetical protein